MKKIVLIGIVREEQDNVKGMLESSAPIIDFVSITCTGDSSDTTPELISEWCTENLMPNRITYCTFENYSQARNYNLKETYSVIEEIQREDEEWYAMFLDADDRLVIKDFNKQSDLSGPCYLIRSMRSVVGYFNERIFSLQYKDWYYEQPIHESLQGEQLKNIQLLPHEKIWVDCRHNGYRRKAPDIFKKDVEILSNYLKDHPDSKRAVYYLAQSYKDGQMREKAIETYKKRVEMVAQYPGRENPEELYICLLNIARLTIEGLLKNEKFQVDRKEILSEIFHPLVKATEIQPHRPEAYIELCRLCLVSGYPSLFEHYLQKAVSSISQAHPHIYGYSELHSLDSFIDLISKKTQYPLGIIDYIKKKLETGEYPSVDPTYNRST